LSHLFSACTVLLFMFLFGALLGPASTGASAALVYNADSHTWSSNSGFLLWPDASSLPPLAAGDILDLGGPTLSTVLAGNLGCLTLPPNITLLFGPNTSISMPGTQFLFVSDKGNRLIIRADTTIKADTNSSFLFWNSTSSGCQASVSSKNTLLAIEQVGGDEETAANTPTVLFIDGTCVNGTFDTIEATNVTNNGQSATGEPYTGYVGTGSGCSQPSGLGIIFGAQPCPPPPPPPAPDSRPPAYVPVVLPPAPPTSFTIDPPSPSLSPSPSPFPSSSSPLPSDEDSSAASALPNNPTTPTSMHATFTITPSPSTSSSKSGGDIKLEAHLDEQSVYIIVAAASIIVVSVLTVVVAFFVLRNPLARERLFPYRDREYNR